MNHLVSHWFLFHSEIQQLTFVPDLVLSVVENLIVFFLFFFLFLCCCFFFFKVVMFINVSLTFFWEFVFSLIFLSFAIVKEKEETARFVFLSGWYHFHIRGSIVRTKIVKAFRKSRHLLFKFIFSFWYF